MRAELDESENIEMATRPECIMREREREREGLDLFVAFHCECFSKLTTWVHSVS